MLYVLRQNGRIVGFGETPFFLSDDQTQDELDSTVLEYSQRFRLTSDRFTIESDEISEAIVTVHTNLDVLSIDVLVNDVVITVDIENGIGVLPGITANTPGTIYIKSADETLYSSAGEGSLVIEAV